MTMDKVFEPEITLPLVALLTSVISGISGLGGGTILMAFMAQTVDPRTLIPMHGLVQLGSNGSRVILGLREVDWRIVGKFFWGAVLGGALGFMIPFELNPKVIGLSVGLFILISTWLPISAMFAKIGGPYWFLGAASTFISLFIGVSGPLVHPILVREKNLNRHAFIATEACCAGLTHLAKLAVYASWGVSMWARAPTLAIMVAMTFAGAFIGKKLLHKFSEKQFHVFIRILVTALAIRLLIQNLK